jgi:hypothetical protein
MLRLLLVAAAIAAGAVAFAPSAARPCRAPQLARRRMAVADTPPEEEDPKRKKTPIEVDEAQLSVLQRRVNALRKAEETATELDLIVLDSMLPGQVLSFKCSKSVLGTLPLPGGFCGMLGVDPRTNTAQPYGSEVEVTAREPYGEEPDVFEVTVRATRVFKIDTEAAVLGEDKGNRKRVLWQTYVNSAPATTALPLTCYHYSYATPAAATNQLAPLSLSLSLSGTTTTRTRRSRRRRAPSWRRLWNDGWRPSSPTTSSAYRTTSTSSSATSARPRAALQSTPSGRPRCSTPSPLWCVVTESPSPPPSRSPSYAVTIAAVRPLPSRRHCPQPATLAANPPTHRGSRGRSARPS